MYQIKAPCQDITLDNRCTEQRIPRTKVQNQNIILMSQRILLLVVSHLRAGLDLVE